MRVLRLTVLYTALVMCANVLAAADIAELEAMREGDMRKLSFHDEPRSFDIAATELSDENDAVRSLSEFEGRWVLLNFWATWCAPCRHEMPSLDRLEAEIGGGDFAVIPVATGRNPLPGIRKFFDETDIAHLPILRDPGQKLSREMGVLGLPVTAILDPEGREIARLTGDAEWDSESAKAILQLLIDTR